MDFLNNVLKPVSLDILSNDRVTDLKTRIQFLVTFEIQFLFWGPIVRFETTGTVETVDLIEQLELSEIISSTDYAKYIDLNLSNREKGNFDYDYLYRDSLLTINYKTF